MKSILLFTIMASCTTQNYAGPKSMLLIMSIIGLLDLGCDTGETTAVAESWANLENSPYLFSIFQNFFYYFFFSDEHTC